MTPPPASLWDPGLQPERTSLAWRRVGISLFGLSLAVPNLAWKVMGVWSVLLTVLVVGVALAIMVSGRHRYAMLYRGLQVPGCDLPQGRLPLATALATLILAAAALAIVLA